MKTLTNEQAEQLLNYQKKLQSASQRVESAVADFNANVKELWNDLVLESINEYNKLVMLAQEFTDETRHQIQESYDSQTQDWQLTVDGVSYSDWIDKWDNVYLEEIESKIPEEKEVPEFPAVKVINELSTEPD